MTRPSATRPSRASGVLRSPRPCGASKWAADIEFCRSWEGQLVPDHEVVVSDPASLVDPPRGGIEIIRLEVQRLAPFTDCRVDSPPQERGRDPAVPEFRMDVDLLHFPESADAHIVICGLLEPFRPEEGDRSGAAPGGGGETPPE